MLVSVNNYPIGNAIAPMYDGKKIIIAIDSSKTNSAVAVADECGVILDWIELNGTADGTSVEDTLALCKKERDILKVIFKNSKPVLVGIEDIITKRQEQGQQTGMTVHQSRFKITAVFMSFISFFQDTFDITPELVNNWTWKSTVLPEEYRTKSYKKGSQVYAQRLDKRFSGCTDDVTDAICILEYLKKKHRIEEVYPVNSIEVKTHDGIAVLVSQERAKKYPQTKFQYNKEYTTKQNIIFMLNRLKVNTVGTAVVDVEWLGLQDIYKLARGSFLRDTKQCVLLVQRR